ncbi:MAG: hypothetical protein ACI4TE_09450, partial [Alphaproteobacteria bacterium]
IEQYALGYTGKYVVHRGIRIPDFVINGYGEEMAAYAEKYGYRYVDFGSFKKNGYKFDTSANEVLLGVRYSF